MKKITLNNSQVEYYKKDWLVLEDGGSGTWLYAVSSGMTYVFIKIDDMIDACGYKEAKQMEGLFCGSVRIVDLLIVNNETIASSLQSVGLDKAIDITKTEDRLEIAMACLTYGACANVWEELRGKVTETYRHNGPDEKHPAFRSLRSDARKEAIKYFNEEVRNDHLNNTVGNAIGSTLSEMMNADFYSALRRVKNDPNATDNQKLVLKMYQNSDRTLDGKEVPKDIKT